MLPPESVKENALPQVKSIIKTTLICKAALVYTDYKQLSKTAQRQLQSLLMEKKKSSNETLEGSILSQYC